MNYQPEIGTNVLETLTTGMYTQPLDCIREFVQNAFDSIKKAEENDILLKNQGKIFISIEETTKCLQISDNGYGIEVENALKKLTDIGKSSKILGADAGFRGIGRLAGIAYCKSLIFRTSSIRDKEETNISFDCEKIRSSLSPEVKTEQDLSDLLKESVMYSKDKKDSKREHYFDVRMEGIISNEDFFLNVPSLENYLCQFGPVEYDAHLFTFAPKIKQWVSEQNLSIPTVNIVLKDSKMERQVKKQYRTKYRTKRSNHDIHIKDILFYPEKIKADTKFWMWYSKTDLLGMFNDDRISGLRFRMNNMQIGGPENLKDLFPGNESRLNYWMIGEIHVLDNKVIPNARRDGFETTPAFLDLKTQLTPFIRDHVKACHEASTSASRPTVKVIKAIDSTMQSVESSLNTGIVSTAEQESLLGKLSKEMERATLALEGREVENEKKEVQDRISKLKELEVKVSDSKNLVLKNVKTSLDRKQQKVIREILAIIHSEFSDVGCPEKQKCLEKVKTAILEKYTFKSE